MQIETTPKETNVLHYRRLKLPAQHPTRTSQAIPEHIPDVNTLHVPQMSQHEQRQLYGVLRVQDVVDNPDLLNAIAMREQYVSLEPVAPIATPFPPPITPLPQPTGQLTYYPYYLHYPYPSQHMHNDSMPDPHHMLPRVAQPIERATYYPLSPSPRMVKRAYYPQMPHSRTVEGAVHYSRVPYSQHSGRAIKSIPPWVPPPPTRAHRFIQPTPEEHYQIDLGTILLALFGAALVILLYLIVPVIATVVPFFSSIWGYIIVTLELIGFGELLVCHVLLKTTKR